MRGAKKTFILQHDKSDCGVACLASIIQYHGGEATLERLRDISGTSTEGTTLLGLYQAAQKLGFNAEGLEAEQIDNLRELSEPAILHVVMENRSYHYLVYYGFDGDKVIVGDPSIGIVHLTPTELKQVWESKSLLKLSPNRSFVKRETSKMKRKEWIIGLIKDDINTLLVSFFIGIIITALGLCTAIFSQKLIDDILPSDNRQKLIFGLILVLLLLLARSALTFIRGIFMLRQGADFNNRIIQKFYGSLLYVPKSFFDTRKVGELIARMNDTRRIQATISIFSSSILIDLLLIVVSFSFTFFYSWEISLVVLASIPFYALVLVKFNNDIIQSQKNVMSRYAITESHYVDSIQGIASIKAFNRQLFFENINKRIYGYFQSSVFSLGELNIRFNLLSEIIGVIFMVVIFGNLSWMVLIKKMQLGEMVATLSIAAGMIPAFNRLVIANIQIQEARVAFNRMYEFTSLNKEDSLLTKTEKINYNFNNLQELSITNLTFRFPGKIELFKEVTLKVQKGQIVSLLGESGIGKSTLIQILQKFYYPTSGKIEVDGIDIGEIPVDIWRKQIAVVPQEIKIFNGSLLYNITLSDQTCDFELAIKFCKKTGFSKFFEALPQGYLTLIGEEGINISGGQKQLVGLARALFVSPKFLLLDEATSAMDGKTENFILELLLTLKKELGIIMVTHRIKTAQRTDRIYVFENGVIKNSCTPNELLH